MTPEEAERHFAGMAATITGRVTVAVERTGLFMVGRIQANASGRPGPRHVFGDYKRSWSVTMDTSDPARPTALVGTNAPQALRLEYGFFGTDSLGRTYRQPPFPHVEPAAEDTERQFIKELDRMVELADAISRG